MLAHSIAPFVPGDKRLRFRLHLQEPEYAEWSRDADAQTFDPGEIVNISEDGVAIESRVLPPLGHEIQLRLESARSGEQFRATGRVVWSGASGRFGLRFLEFSPGSLICLRQWLLQNAIPSTAAETALPAPAQSDFDLALTLIAERAHKLLRTSAAAIALVTNESEVLRCLARSGPCAPSLGAKLRVGSGFSGTCVRSGMIVACTDTERDSRVDAKYCRALGARSLLAVPLRAGSSIWGLIEVFSSHPRGYSDQDLVVLYSLGQSVLNLLKHTPQSVNGCVPYSLEPLAVERFKSEAQATPPLVISEPSRVSRFPWIPMAFVAVIAATGLGLSTLPMQQHQRQSAPVTRPIALSQEDSATLLGSETQELDNLDLETLRRRANEGDADSQNSLAKRYLTGDASQGLRPDAAEAARWFSAAAEAGNVAAQSRLAYLFWSGRGVPQNLEKAYFWAGVASRNPSSPPVDPAVSLARTLTQVLTHSGLSKAEARAIEREAETWRPQRP